MAVDWRQKELGRIDATLAGAERKVALSQLIDEEAQLISCIARRRAGVIEDNKKTAVKKFLKKVHAHLHYLMGIISHSYCRPTIKKVCSLFS